MNKNDLKLIHSFVDQKNPKYELNYAWFGDDGVYATDTRKAICFHAPMLGLDMLLHKKILGGFIAGIGKDSKCSVDGLGYIKSDDGFKMSCDTYDKPDPSFPRMTNSFDTQFEFKMTLTDIDDIHFELTQRECFVDDVHLLPIIEYSSCHTYEVFFNKQKVDKDTTNTGIVKIVGIFNEDGEADKIKFTAIVMGREFKTQTQEQLLMGL